MPLESKLCLACFRFSVECTAWHGQFSQSNRHALERAPHKLDYVIDMDVMNRKRNLEQNRNINVKNGHAFAHCACE